MASREMTQEEIDSLYQQVAKDWIEKNKSPATKVKEKVIQPVARNVIEPMAADFWKNLVDYAKDWIGMLETGANVASQWGAIPSGLAGLAGIPFGKSQDWMDFVHQLTVYEPKTEKGKQLTETIFSPITALGKGADWVATKVTEAAMKNQLQPEYPTEGIPFPQEQGHMPPEAAAAMGTLAGTAIMSLPMLLGKYVGKATSVPKSPHEIQPPPGGKLPAGTWEQFKPDQIPTIEVPPELQAPALPPGQGFQILEKPKTILRKAEPVEPKVYVKSTTGDYVERKAPPPLPKGYVPLTQDIPLERKVPVRIKEPSEQVPPTPQAGEIPTKTPSGPPVAPPSQETTIKALPEVKPAKAPKKTRGEAALEQILSEKGALTIPQELVDVAKSVESWLKDQVKDFRKTVEFMSDIKKWPEAVEEFRVFMDEPSRARNWGVRKVQEIVDPIKKLPGKERRQQTSVFVDYIINKDLEERALSGKKLPEGKTLAEVQNDLQRLSGQLTPEIRQAADKHYEVVKEVRDALISEGLLDPEQAIESYYPHVTLDYLWENEPLIRGTATGRITPAWYEKPAHGSVRSIETNYFNAMVKMLSSFKFNEAKRAFIRRIADRYDQLDTLWPRIAEKYDFSDPKKRFEALRHGEVFEIDGQRWKIYQPEPGRYIFPATNVTQNQLIKVAEGLLDPMELKANVMALGHQKPVYLLPEEIATRLETLGKEAVASSPIRKANWVTNAWKGLTIDLGGTAWNILQAMSDPINLYRANPKALLWMPKALKELLKHNFVSPSDIVKLAEEMSVIQSTYMRNEIPQRMMEFNAFKPPLARALGFGQELRQRLHTLFDIREATPRVAYLMDSLERMAKAAEEWEANPNLQQLFKKDDYMKSKIVAPDIPKDIKERLTAKQVAGKAAREVSVDYRAFTSEVDRLGRGLLFPFMAWTWKNTPMWYRYIANQPGRFLIKFVLPRIMLEVWNNTVAPEAERSLSDLERAIPHIFPGFKDKDGKELKIFFVGDPVSDALSVFGLDSLPPNVSDVALGRLSLTDAAKKQLKNILPSIEDTVLNLASPFFKAPLEAALNKRLGKVGGTIYYEARRPYVWDWGGEAWDHILGSLARPIRETESLTELLKSEKFDPLQYRYLGGLPYRWHDTELADLQRQNEAYYQMRKDFVREYVDFKRRAIEGFDKLPRNIQSIKIAQWTADAERKFYNRVKPPLTSKGRLWYELSELEKRKSGEESEAQKIRKMYEDTAIEAERNKRQSGAIP